MCASGVSRPRIALSRPCEPPAIFLTNQLIPTSSLCQTIWVFCPPDTKRESGQGTLDSSLSIDSPGCSPRKSQGFLRRALRQAHTQARDSSRRRRQGRPLRNRPRLPCPDSLPWTSSAPAFLLLIVTPVLSGAVLVRIHVYRID